MSFLLLSPGLVEAIHAAILEPNELTGVALDKSLAATLARVENRLTYGMIEDVFDLAAAYTIAIARGECFYDGNIRTAFRSLQVCLDLNGVSIPWNNQEIGSIVVRCAEGQMTDNELAAWLRERAQ